jgi:hypothetical protein
MLGRQVSQAFTLTFKHARRNFIESTKRKGKMKFAPLALIERIQARILPRQACESLNPIHPPEIGPLLRHLGAITHSISDEQLIHNIQVPEFRLAAELIAKGDNPQTIIQELAAEYTDGKLNEARKIFHRSVPDMKQTARNMGIAFEEDR